MRITQAGVSLGTPTYVAPEQATNDPSLDHRADIYALGCVLYEMLCGQVPYPTRAESLGGMGPVPMLALSPLIPPRVEQLVLRMIAIDPSHRPASMAEVGQVLSPLPILGQVGVPGQAAVPDRFAEGTRSDGDRVTRQLVITPPAAVARPRRVRTWLTAFAITAAFAIGSGAGLAISRLF